MGLLAAPFTVGMSMAIAAAYVTASTVAQAKGQNSIFQLGFEEVNKVCGTDIGVFVNLFITSLVSFGNPFLFLQIHLQ